MTEERPYAMRHKDKGPAWQRCAKHLREAAKKSGNAFVRAKATFITKTNLWKRIKQLRVAHKDEQWHRLRTSGSQEEYDTRTELADALVADMEGAEMEHAEGVAEKLKKSKVRQQNGKALLRALFDTATEAGALAKKGAEHAAQAGVRDWTIVKTSTVKPNHEELLAAIDKAQEAARSSNDQIQKLEKLVDETVLAVEEAVASEEAEKKAVGMRLETMQSSIDGLTRMMKALLPLVGKAGAEAEENKEG